MRTIFTLVPLALIAGGVAVQACNTNVPDDTVAGNQLTPAGVIRGNVVYNGPPPCTQNGQVVGNAIILVFDRRNPPPPSGVATTAVNFAVVSGDLLFANVNRTTGAALQCPAAGAATVFASSSFTISPMSAGSYIIQAFYDTTGDFLPTFKFRDLPEATDVAGGYIDVNDAEELVPSNSESPIEKLIDGGPVFPLVTKSSNASYQPIFLPVDIGTPGPVLSGSLRDVPTFTMPATGYLADNVTVNIASTLSLARPYFYPEGVYLPIDEKTNAPVPNTNGVTIYGSSATRPAAKVVTPTNPTGDVDYVPVLTFPQDIGVYAQPNPQHISAAPAFQASFPQLTLHWGVPSAEAAVAADTSKQADPFHMQLANPPAAGAAAGGNNGLYIFQYNSSDASEFDIPEGTIPRLWPLIVLAKLDDDPTHQNDPQSITYQGSDLTKPVVIIQGITLYQDSLLNTLGNTPIPYPDPTNLSDHVSVMLRPNVVCLDPRHIDLGGTIVTPYLCNSYPPGDSSESQVPGCPSNPQQGAILNPQVYLNPQLQQLVKQDGSGVQFGCLPTGRYGINMVYPTGQAWTAPNEIGSCAAVEGQAVLGAVGGTLTDPGRCSVETRPVLYSQGTRAVVEITPSTSGACKTVQTTPGIGQPGPVPSVCTTLTGD
jgi:hypothetical protein